MQTDIDYLRGIAEIASLPALMSKAIRDAAAEIEQARDRQDNSATELLDLLQDMARQHCYTELPDASEPGLTDSGALSVNADVLTLLAAHGRFRVVRRAGRMVCGYWPEDDEEHHAD